MIGLRSARRRDRIFGSPTRFRTSLAGGPWAPAEARRVVCERLSASVRADAVETIRLLTSELVTNCVRHAGADEHARIELVVSSLLGKVRIEVSTAGPGFTPPSLDGAPAAQEEHGRGLYIVEKLAQRWGSGPSNSNAVWFEVAT